MNHRIERIGDCELHLADCREVLPTLGRVDAMITDPPYGIGLTKKTSDFRGSRWFDNGASAAASKTYDDDPDEIRALIAGTMPALIAKATRALVFSGPAMLWAYPEPASLGCVFAPNGAGRTAWGFQCNHPVLFYGKDPFLQDGLGGRPNSLRDEQPNKEKIDHPCPKPVAWMKWAIARASRPDEVVLDPFMGSGTTAIAAIQLGRKFIGIEREPSFFDIACERIRKTYDQPDMFVSSPSPKAEQLDLLGATE